MWEAPCCADCVSHRMLARPCQRCKSILHSASVEGGGRERERLLRADLSSPPWKERRREGGKERKGSAKCALHRPDPESRWCRGEAPCSGAGRGGAVLGGAVLFTQRPVMKCNLNERVLQRRCPPLTGPDATDLQLITHRQQHARRTCITVLTTNTILQRIEGMFS